MARTISIEAMKAALAQSTNEVFVSLIDITHPDMVAPIYLCDDSTDLVHTPPSESARTYHAFPFTFTIPTDESEQEPQVKLIVPNIDRSIIDDIRSISSGPRVTIRVVLASAPNTVIYGPVRLKALAAPYNAETIQLSLGFESYTGEPLPYPTFSPNLFPSMFK